MAFFSTLFVVSTLLSKLMRKVGRKYNICVSIIFIVFHLVLCSTLCLLFFVVVFSVVERVLLLLLLLLYYINAQALCYIYFDKCSVGQDLFIYIECAYKISSVVILSGRISVFWSNFAFNCLPDETISRAYSLRKLQETSLESFNKIFFSTGMFL